MEDDLKIDVTTKPKEDSYFNHDKDEDVLCIIKYVYLKENAHEEDFELSNGNKWTSKEVLGYIDNCLRKLQIEITLDYVRKVAKENKYNPDEDNFLQNFRKRMREL